MNLRQKRALVVCGSSPLGIAIIEEFTRLGASVTTTTRTGRRQDLEALQLPISILDLDLDDDASIDACVEQINKGEKIDFVVFVCGHLSGCSLDEYVNEEIDRTFAVNIVAQTKFLKGILQQINNAGSVIFISSIAATAGSYDPVYAAAKAAQIGLTKSLARHYGREVRFNVLAPGTIADSPMVRTFTAENLERHISETPTGRLNTNEELAQIVVNVCGEAWANLNGQVIAVNGGRYV